MPRASFLGCPLLSWAALYCCYMGECVLPLLVSVLMLRWRSCGGGGGGWRECAQCLQTMHSVHRLNIFVYT